MSRVVYDGKRIIPAPLVTINKTYTKNGNGDIIGKIYTLTITGTIVAHMGSPNSTGVFHTTSGYPDDEVIPNNERLKAIMRKQEALRNLFSVEGKNFYIQSADGSQPISCYPRINSIDFAEGIWYERCDYTINLECDVLDGLYDEEASSHDAFTEYLQSASEDWNIDTNDEPESLGGPSTYALSHTVSAVGKKFYDETGAVPTEPWQYAQQYVLSRLGFSNYPQEVLSSGVHNLPSYYNGWNHKRTEQIDKAGGGFTVSENWVLASGSAIESFNITSTDSLDSPYQVIQIQGNVQGYEEFNSDMELTTNKWTNAQTKFAWASGVAFTRAQSYSGTSLNVIPLSMTVGRNPLQGSIDYTFEYNSRPVNLIENARSESINISDNIGGELFASVFVLGRAKGPVLQDLNTKPANTRTLSIEIVVDPPTYSDRTVATMEQLINDQKPSAHASFQTDINNLVAAAHPNYLGATTEFHDQPQESWDFKEGRYSYNVTWTYET